MTCLRQILSGCPVLFVTRHDGIAKPAAISLGRWHNLGLSSRGSDPFAPTRGVRGLRTIGCCESRLLSLAPSGLVRSLARLGQLIVRTQRHLEIQAQAAHSPNLRYLIPLIVAFLVGSDGSTDLGVSDIRTIQTQAEGVLTVQAQVDMATMMRAGFGSVSRRTPRKGSYRPISSLAEAAKAWVRQAVASRFVGLC